MIEYTIYTNRNFQLLTMTALTENILQIYFLIRIKSMSSIQNIRLIIRIINKHKQYQQRNSEYELNN